ncbi:hypothetical protein C8R44DRAFT_730278 [Mycena epipterygia]|nr:hypothetical protein C8R44DRAFT_730278 [Mycena epipterygia]
MFQLFHAPGLNPRRCPFNCTTCWPCIDTELLALDSTTRQVWKDPRLITVISIFDLHYLFNFIGPGAHSLSLSKPCRGFDKWLQLPYEHGQHFLACATDLGTGGAGSGSAHSSIHSRRWGGGTQTAGQT